ncbi:hypothetical protein DQ04_09181040 [Trypanosoma grayi]|uniref:hypothetical protein n=1 Tax=Trypanosoma grayi TaxID=71804 RepID=UPI0004F3F12A|nr:hypothetical protein DQ04_09181040 [Trypanosoma grayi]KEG07652.1 hypothetical protein DQ04_09181040 [Trypanosoma grayi]
MSNDVSLSCQPDGKSVKCDPHSGPLACKEPKTKGCNTSGGGRPELVCPGTGTTEGCNQVAQPRVPDPGAAQHGIPAISPPHDGIHKDSEKVRTSGEDGQDGQNGDKGLKGDAGGNGDLTGTEQGTDLPCVSGGENTAKCPSTNPSSRLPQQQVNGDAEGQRGRTESLLGKEEQGKAPPTDNRGASGSGIRDGDMNDACTNQAGKEVPTYCTRSTADKGVQTNQSNDSERKADDITTTNAKGRAPITDGGLSGGADSDVVPSSDRVVDGEESADDHPNKEQSARPPEDTDKKNDSDEPHALPVAAVLSAPEVTSNQPSDTPVANTAKDTKNTDSSVSPVWVHAPLLLLTLFAVTAV